MQVKILTCYYCNILYCTTLRKTKNIFWKTFCLDFYWNRVIIDWHDGQKRWQNVFFGGISLTRDAPIKIFKDQVWVPICFFYKAEIIKNKFYVVFTNFQSKFHKKVESVLSHEVSAFGIGAFLWVQAHDLSIRPDNNTHNSNLFGYVHMW